MKQTPAEGLSSTYRRAVATGEITKAHGIALRGVRLFEERYDLKLASFWRRALYKTLYYRGRYDEAATEAERSADIEPDAYERARSLILLGESNCLCLKLNAAFIALGRAEKLARSFRKDMFLNRSQ